MRRNFLRMMAACSFGLISGCAGRAIQTARPTARVVVVGGGFAGATVAKYLRVWSQGGIAVTLIERNRQFVSCPVSNLVLAGERSLADISIGYSGLSQLGVDVIHAQAEWIDPEKRQVHIAGGLSIPYDRCVLAPGVDFMTEGIPGLASDAAPHVFPHAYKAGAQTVKLRKQLEAMPDGGVYALTVPKVPYVCPPGPYERASVVADYFRRYKPRSKVLILDANDGVVSKRPLFLQAWAEFYPEIIEYHPNMHVRDADADSKSVMFDFDQISADVWNVIPPQRIGKLGSDLGLKRVNGRWAEVDWLTLESVSHPAIHVIGDATFSAPLMPKSGHMANQQAKVLAAALVNLLAGQEVNPNPKVMNTCYSFVSLDQAMHVATIFAYDREQRTFLAIPKSGGLSERASGLEARYALGWAQNIWADSFAAVY